MLRQLARLFRKSESATILEKDKIDLFSEILAEIMTKLGFPGEIVPFYIQDDEDDTIVFRFRTVADIKKIYPAIQDNYDRIRETVNSRELDMRVINGNLELKFPRVVVFMARAIKNFNPELEV